MKPAWAVIFVKGMPAVVRGSAGPSEQSLFEKYGRVRPFLSKRVGRLVTLPEAIVFDKRSGAVEWLRGLTL